MKPLTELQTILPHVHAATFAAEPSVVVHVGAEHTLRERTQDIPVKLSVQVALPHEQPAPSLTIVPSVAVQSGMATTEH